MGIYDSFWADPVPCPKCGKLTNGEFQTKTFPDPYLRRWRVGDMLKVQEVDLKDARIGCYAHCLPCNKLIEAWVCIKDNCFISIELQD